MAVKKTTDEFNREIQGKYGTDIAVHGEYLGAQKNVSIICKEGHVWEVLATNLLQRGTRSFCNICKKGIYNRIMTWNTDNIDKLRQYALRNTPLVDIASSMGCSEISILNACAKFGISRPKVSSSIQKLCTKLIEQDRTLVSSLEEIHSVHDKATIQCSRGHVHDQLIGNIMYNNTGCPSCFSEDGCSKGETEVYNFIRKIYSGSIIRHNRSSLGGTNKELDIILPELKLAFEYNGVWWHREEKVGKNYHLDKQNNAKIYSKLDLVHIYDAEWELKQDIIKSRIASMLGGNLSIFARSCVLRKISFPKEFLEANHLQGAGSPSTYNYGLFYKEELVAAMTFGTSRFDKQYTYELIRYCSLSGINLVGGASRLLKAFRAEYLGSIITYSDKRWSRGNMYIALGFSYLRTSAPGYRYFKKLKGFSRFMFQKHKLQSLFPSSFEESLTEREIMKLEGYHAVYDCGNDVWVLP